MFAGGFDMQAPFPPRVGMESIEKRQKYVALLGLLLIPFFLLVFPNKMYHHPIFHRIWHREIRSEPFAHIVFQATNPTMPGNVAAALTAKLRTMRLH